MKASIQNNLVYRGVNDLIVPYFILYVYIEIVHGSLKSRSIHFKFIYYQGI